MEGREWRQDASHTLMLDDTIAAIATPVGEGALAVIRLSGKDAFSVADKVFVPGAKTYSRISAAPTSWSVDPSCVTSVSHSTREPTGVSWSTRRRTGSPGGLGALWAMSEMIRYAFPQCAGQVANYSSRRRRSSRVSRRTESLEKIAFAVGCDSMRTATIRSTPSRSSPGEPLTPPTTDGTQRAPRPTTSRRIRTRSPPTAGAGGRRW